MAKYGIENVMLTGQGIPEKLHLKDPRLFGYNRANIYYGGNRIGTFDKADDASEFSAELPRPTMIPGIGTNTFDYPGTKIPVGVEVCADHGRLRALDKRVRIQLLVSAQIGVSVVEIVVPDNGMLISCNGGQRAAFESGVYIAGKTGKPNQQFVVDETVYVDVETARKANQSIDLYKKLRCQRTDLA